MDYVHLQEYEKSFITLGPVSKIIKHSFMLNSAKHEI